MRAQEPRFATGTRGSLRAEETVADLDVRIGFPVWLRPFVLKGVAGITLGSRIYLDPSVAELPADRAIAILHHEIVHVNQYQRHGVVAFLVRYAFEYLRNRAGGLSAAEAYRQISFEREAFGEEPMIERACSDA